MGERGSYAKGIAKREEILERSLEVIAREGYHGASVKVLADAVGLSQAGLLHYFGSKEALFTEILRKRDETAVAEYGDEIPLDIDSHAEFLAHIRRNAGTPGLVQLSAQLAVDAADKQHPAHDFFAQRGAIMRRLYAQGLAPDAAERGLDTQTVARLIQATADGLQLQWLLDRDVDMAAVMDLLLTLLESAGQDRVAGAAVG